MLQVIKLQITALRATAPQIKKLEISVHQIMALPDIVLLQTVAMAHLNHMVLQSRDIAIVIPSKD